MHIALLVCAALSIRFRRREADHAHFGRSTDLFRSATQHLLYDMSDVMLRR